MDVVRGLRIVDRGWNWRRGRSAVINNWGRTGSSHGIVHSFLVDMYYFEWHVGSCICLSARYRMQRSQA